jgi:hypothetical protein
VKTPARKVTHKEAIHIISQRETGGPYAGTGAAALAYASAGWPVFPCRPGAAACPYPVRCECKAPLGELVPHGLADATTDPAVIRGWWARCPGANVAIATGAPAVDVLDVDVKPAGNGWAAFNRLKRAGLLRGAMVLVRTPSGGLHVYFVGTEQPCRSLVRAGHFIELKARGGYVLASPSTVHGRPYEVLDVRARAGRLDWQAAGRLLCPPPPFARAHRGGGDARHLVAWVAAQAEGNRNHGLYWAARRAIESGADPAGLVPAAVQAGLPEAEARRTVASAARGAER